MESPSIAELPAFEPYHWQEKQMVEPELTDMGGGFSDPEIREGAALLATLSLLASRFEPEMSAVSKVLCSQLEWSDQRAALIGAEILAASGLFVPSKNPSLFSTQGGRTTSLAVDRRVFDDHELQLALWKAADPDFALLQSCAVTPAAPSAVVPKPVTAMAAQDDSDGVWGPHMVSSLLAKVGIHYTLDGSIVTIDTQPMMNKLVWGYHWVPEAAEHIYKTIFSRESWAAIFETLEQEGDWSSELEAEKDDFVIDFYSFDHLSVEGFDGEMKQSLKLLAVSVTLFLGAGLFLGHTLT